MYHQLCLYNVHVRVNSRIAITTDRFNVVSLFTRMTCTPSASKFCVLCLFVTLFSHVHAVVTCLLFTCATRNHPTGALEKSARAAGLAAPRAHDYASHVMKAMPGTRTVYIHVRPIMSHVRAIIPKLLFQF